MAKRTTVLFPKTIELLQEFGENLRLARLRRNIHLPRFRRNGPESAG